MNHRFRRSAAASLVLSVALASPVPAVGPQRQPTTGVDPLAIPPDFPPADSRIWTLQQKGLTAKLAAQALTRAPEAPETLDCSSRQCVPRLPS
jgi:hypothetical protein